MTSVEQEPPPVGASSRLRTGSVADDPVARIGPMRLLLGLARAAAAVATAAWAARSGPDPMDLCPRVLREG